MSLWRRGKSCLMKNNKPIIKRGFSYNNMFSALDESTKKRVIKIEIRLIRLIERFKLKNEKVKLNKKAKKNIFQEEKLLKKYKQRINKKEITRVYGDQKILLEFFYDKKNDKLFLNSIYIFDKKLSKKNDKILLVLHSFVFLLPIGYSIYLYHKEKLPNDKELEKKLLYIFGSYSLLGIIFLYRKIKLHLKNEYKLRKISFFESLNMSQYTTNYSSVTGLISLLFFSTQFLLVNLLAMKKYPDINFNIILLLTIFIDLYCLINLLISFLVTTGANFTFLVLCLALTLFLGIITRDNWVLVTLFLAIISIIISKDIWRISEDRVNPLGGAHDTSANNDIVDRNVYVLKLILGSSSLILYSIISILGDNTIILDFYNKNSISAARICKNSFPGIIFIGFDRVLFMLFCYVFIHLINVIYKIFCKRSLIDILKCWMSSIVKNISALVYRGIK